jgi:hypothetical protein
VFCPRCEEVIPYLSNGHPEEDEPVEGRRQPWDGTGWPDQETPRERWSNRAIATLVLITMAIMAGAGFTLAWFTTKERRQRDFPEPAAAPQTTTTTVWVAPANLTALGYIAPDTNLVAGVHVRELLHGSGAGTAMVQRLIGFLGSVRLEDWTGLPLDQIDHLVCGSKFDDRLIPRMLFVVQTVKPYDLNGILAKLNASRTRDRNGRTIYRFTPAGGSFELYLWCPAERTLVLGTGADDFDGVLSAPVADLQRFPAGMQQLLKERLDIGTQFWAVAGATDWQNIQKLLANVWQFKQDLAGLRTVGLWLDLKNEAAWHLGLECVDDSAAVKLGKTVGSWVNPKDTKAPVEPVRRFLSGQWQLDIQGNWINAKAKVPEGGLPQ